MLSIFTFYLKDNIKIPERSASCEDDDEEDEGEAADMEGISLIEWDAFFFQAFSYSGKLQENTTLFLQNAC